MYFRNMQYSTLVTVVSILFDTNAGTVFLLLHKSALHLRQVYFQKQHVNISNTLAFVSHNV